jgi:hypothetical protein
MFSFLYFFWFMKLIITPAINDIFMKFPHFEFIKKIELYLVGFSQRVNNFDLKIINYEYQDIRYKSLFFFLMFGLSL